MEGGNKLVKVQLGNRNGTSEVTRQGRGDIKEVAQGASQVQRNLKESDRKANLVQPGLNMSDIFLNITEQHQSRRSLWNKH